MKSIGNWTKNYYYDFTQDNYLLKHDENGQNTYTYDEHGNMTKMPHLEELKWDYKDNFKETTLDLAGNKAFYTYDASGNRVRKVVIKNNGSIVEDRIYVGDYEIYRKTTNENLNVERETLHINDDKQRIAQIDSDSSTTTVRYQLSDHLGSASLELDENAEIISYEEYYPFGTTSYRSGRSESDVSMKRYKYVMKELDNERRSPLEHL